MFKLKLGAAMIPHPQKFPGEDAVFIDHDSSSFVIADGVGGWREQGVNAGDFARELCSGADSFITGSPNVCCLDPQKLMDFSWRHACSPGSSTLLAGVLAHNHLRYANIGDSGFCIFRSGRGADAATERGDDDNDLQSNSSFAAVSSTASSPAGASDRSFDEVCRRHQREHHSASTPTTPSLSPASDRASPSAHSPSPRHGSGGGNHSVHQHHSRENGDNDSDDDDDHSPRVAAAWDRSPALPFPNPLQHASSVGCASGSPSMRRVSSHHGLARVRDETDADAEPAPSSEDAHQDGGKQAAEQSTANDHGDELRLPPLFAQFSGWDSDENAPQTVFSSVWSPPPTPRRDAFTNELLRSRVELLSLSFSPIPLVPIFSVDRMQHAFNFPFQLTSLRTLLEFAPPAGKTVDTPDEALSGFIRLQIGDVIVAGSDGLWDNLFDADIAAAVRARFDPLKPWRSARMADDIARAAHAIGLGGARVASTPFAVAASRAGLGHLRGGKLDDVSVVVGIVTATNGADGRGDGDGGDSAGAGSAVDTGADVDGEASVGAADEGARCGGYGSSALQTMTGIDVTVPRAIGDGDVGGGATVLNAASIGRVHLPPRIVAFDAPNGDGGSLAADPSVAAHGSHGDASIDEQLAAAHGRAVAAAMGAAAVERQRSVRLADFDWRGMTVATDTPTAQRILAANVRGARGGGASATAGAENDTGECCIQ